MATSPPEEPAGSIRVLIAESHPVLRGVVRLACEASPRLQVVGEVETGEEAVEAGRTLAPDVIILDLSLAGIEGLEVARLLRSEGSSAKIVVLSGRSDEQTVFESIRAGADGYLEKTAGVRSIVEALEQVVAGERVFTPEQEQGALRELGRVARRAREVSGVASKITPRELEVLEYVSHGLTVGQVASRMGLSPRTVETHLAKICRKLGVSNRVQALARAASLGLIDLGWRAVHSPSIQADRP